MRVSNSITETWAHVARSLACLAYLVILTTLCTSAYGQPKPRRQAKSSVRKTTSGRPGLQYEQFRRRIALQVAEKREEQISGLKRLIELGPEPAEMPDLKFRLGELYYEKSQYYFFRAQEAEEASMAAEDASTKAQHMAAQEVHTKASKQWLQKALGLYREIRERYPKYVRGPEVLFALGQSYWSQQRYDEAVEAYADLIRNFRDSPLVSEAWIAFGEYYFSKGSIYKALKSYENAATDKRSRVYGFALYKQAWCYYNLAEWNKALRLFRGTVLYSQLSDQLSGENKIALGREAQKDWVLTYSHVGKAMQAKFQISDLLGVQDCTDTSCQKLLEQLAGLWFDEGYFEESAYLYKELIVLASDPARNAYFQGRVVDLVSRSGDKARVVEETRRLVKIYERARESVANAAPVTDDTEITPAERFEEAQLLSETTLRRLAQLWNREGKKTRNEKTYAFAQTMYTEYLRLFSDSKYAYEMRFQLADLYYKLERFDEAAAEYETTVQSNPKGQYVAEAANDNILAIEEHLKDLGVRRPKLKGATPVPLHPQKQRLVDACDRYAKYVAYSTPEQTDRFVAVKFKAGKTMYDYNQHDQALLRLDDVVKSHPKSEQAEFAANLVVDIHNLREDWQGLYTSASSYLKNADLVDGRPKLANELAQFGEYAKFKLVQILETRVKTEEGDLRLVGQAYEDFTTEFPRSKNADKALFNASVAWDRAGQVERADALRRRLLKQYPDSPLVAEVALYVAKQAAARADYDIAAQAYLKFAKKFPTDARARDALYNAAVFYAGLGKVKTANGLRTKYLKDYGRVKGGEREASDIYWSIARDLERARRYRTAANRYRDYAKEFPETERFWEALWREATIRHKRLRQKKTADKIRNRLLGIYLNLKQKGRAMPPSALSYASQVAFRRVKKDYDKYRAMRIKTPNLRNPKPFRQSLAKKASARTRLIKMYTRVVSEFQQADSTVASLYRIARTWDIFVDAIVKLPCPRGLRRDACEDLKTRLEEEASPAREAALQAYQTCVDKSNELNTYTPFSTRCVRALERRAPDRYPKIVEKRLPYDPRPRVERLKGRSLILDYDGFAVAKEVSAQAPVPETSEAVR